MTVAGLIGLDESHCADLISPHRFMGWETKGAQMLLKWIWIDTVDAKA